MIGRFYIDGIDAYSAFGVFITEGSYNKLLEYPPLKKPKSIDWQEEDGEEFDLSAPVLDSHEVSINFAARGLQYNIGAFIELLSDQSYHTFEFRELGRTYKLRLVSQSGLKLGSRLGLFTLRFADDFPLDGYTHQPPATTLAAPQGYELDGVSLSKYGVNILKGSLEEIEKMPAVKKNLLCNIQSQSGVIYDGTGVRFQTKDVKITCLMRASSLPEFWQNYDALLFDLSKPNERMLYVDQTGCTYPCYYKSCSGKTFSPMGKIWFEFTLVLVFTSFRVDADEFVLETDGDHVLVTEDEIYAIDLEQ